MNKMFAIISLTLTCGLASAQTDENVAILNASDLKCVHRPLHIVFPTQSGMMRGWPAVITTSFKVMEKGSFFSNDKELFSKKLGTTLPVAVAQQLQEQILPHANQSGGTLYLTPQHIERFGLEEMQNSLVSLQMNCLESTLSALSQGAEMKVNLDSGQISVLDR